MISIALSSFLLFLLTVVAFNNKTKFIENILGILTSLIALGLIWLPFIYYQQIFILPLVFIFVCTSFFFINQLSRGVKVVKNILGLCFLTALILFPEQLNIHEYEFKSNHPLLLILMMFILFGQGYLSIFIDRLLKIILKSDFESSAFVYLFLSGILFLVAFKETSYFGIAFILSSYILSFQTQKDLLEIKSFVFLFLSLAFGTWLLSYTDGLFLFEGSTLFSILLSISVYYFFSQIRNHIESRIIYWVLILCCSSLFIIPLIGGYFNPLLGSAQHFILVLFIMALFSFSEVSWSEKENTLLFSLMVLGSILFTLLYDQKNANENLVRNVEFNVENWEASHAFDQLKNQSLEGIQGSYKVNETPTEFIFELGPKNARTKGVFKQVKGKITLEEELEKSVFSIEIPLNGLSTFDEYRDEVLMEEEYFNFSKYKSITFNSSLMKIEENSITIHGKMNMIGVEKDLSFEAKFEKQEAQTLMLYGIGSIDRTLFGMEPDASIGNLVDFSFKIKLEKE